MREDRGFGQSHMRPPVSEGEELELTIEAVGEKGDGIAKKQGFVIFVPNTSQGSRVKVKVTRVLRKVAFGEVLEQLGTAEDAPEEAPEENSEAPEEAQDEEEKKEDSEEF